jgi:hypothetical protein
MNKKYIVSLTANERQYLEKIVNGGKSSARKIKKAWILLQADVGPDGPAWSDEQIQQAYSVSLATIYRVRQTLVESGFDSVLSRKTPCRHRRRALDGEQEAHLIALACSRPPAGRKRWTLRQLPNA